jgi:hypothetical protein
MNNLVTNVAHMHMGAVGHSMHVGNMGHSRSPMIGSRHVMHAYRAHGVGRHHHHRRFFVAGFPYYDYYYNDYDDSDCWWSQRRHHWVCGSY